MRSIRLAALAFAALSLAGCKGLRSSGGDAGSSGGIFSTLASLVGFEGEIDLAIAMPGLGTPMTTTLKLKGKKMRMDYAGMAGVPGSGMGIIYDGETKKSYTLMPTAHQYIETDLSKLPSSTPPPSGPKPVAKKTGTTDKIAGYDCENWIVATPGSPNTSELCVAHGLTFYAMGFGPFASFGTGETWGGALDGGGFPLRMRTLDASGKETMRMEATRIERKAESDADFQIPPGYTKSGIGGPFGGGVGGGGGPPP